MLFHFIVLSTCRDLYFTTNVCKATKVKNALSVYQYLYGSNTNFGNFKSDPCRNAISWITYSELELNARWIHIKFCFLEVVFLCNNPNFGNFKSDPCKNATSWTTYSELELNARWIHIKFCFLEGVFLWQKRLFSSIVRRTLLGINLSRKTTVQCVHSWSLSQRCGARCVCGCCCIHLSRWHIGERARLYYFAVASFSQRTEANIQDRVSSKTAGFTYAEIAWLWLSGVNRNLCSRAQFFSAREKSEI